MTSRLLQGVALLVTLVASSGFLVPSASASGPPAAVAEYVETPPTSGGASTPGGGGSVSSSVRRDLTVKGGTDAGTLLALATSSAYASQRTSGAPTIRPSTRGAGAVAPALAGAVASIGGGRLLGLAAVLAAVVLGFCVLRLSRADGVLASRGTR